MIHSQSNLITRWLWPLALLALILSACSVSVTLHRVSITPEAVDVKPGGSVRLQASTNYQTTSDIVWTLGPEDSRPAREVLSDRTGPSTTYVAPPTDGVYTVVAQTLDETTAVSGVARIRVDSFLDAEVFFASTSPDAPILVGQPLAAGASRVLAVDVDSGTAASGGALFIELKTESGQNLALEVRNEDRSPYASSSSSAFFARGLTGLGSAGLEPQELEPQAIGVARACQGACVIRDARPGRSYLRVTNRSATRQTYSLHAYVADFGDRGEPGNDDASGATPLSGDEQGAIETLADEDYYRASVAGELAFTAPAASAPIRDRLRAEVIDRNGRIQQTLRVGESYDRVIPGDLVRVYVEGGTHAGAAAVSRYVLVLTAAE